MQAPPQDERRWVAAVGAVVVDHRTRILLVRRARAPSLGAWTLPGGRLEPHESFEEAVAREVREETSLSTRVVCPLGIVPLAREGYAYAIHEYLLVPVDDTAPLAPGDDAAEARWVARGELEGLGVSAEVAAVIDRGLQQAQALGVQTG